MQPYTGTRKAIYGLSRALFAFFYGFIADLLESVKLMIAFTAYVGVGGHDISPFGKDEEGGRKRREIYFISPFSFLLW